jgi:hypothetical protein
MKKIKYTGHSHPILEYGKTYFIFKPETVTKDCTGLQVITDTGFCGIQKPNFKFVE